MIFSSLSKHALFWTDKILKAYMNVYLKIVQNSYV